MRRPPELVSSSTRGRGGGVNYSGDDAQLWLALAVGHCRLACGDCQRPSWGELLAEPEEPES